jgi:YVTN family beta-propeller protein
VELIDDGGGACVGPGEDKVLTSLPVHDDVLKAGVVAGGPDFTCDTTAQATDVQLVPVATVQRILGGHDDWSNLWFRGAPGAGSFPVPAPRSVVEPPYEQVQQIQQDWDEALTPDRAVRLAAPVTGFQQGVLGVAVDGKRVYATYHAFPPAGSTTPSQPGELVVLDRDTLAVQRRVTVGFSPRAVAVDPAANRIYVANAGTKLASEQSNSLTVLDRSTLKVLATVPLGGAPADVAVNRKLHRVYVSDINHGRILVLDGATNTLLAPVTVGPGPLGLAVDEVRNRVHVALNNRSTEPHVTALGTVVDDGASTTVLPPVPLGEEGNQPQDVAVDTRTGQVYVADLGGGGVTPNVKRVDQVGPFAGQVTATVPLAGPARAIALSEAAGKVVVAGDGQLHVIEFGATTVARRIPSGFGNSVALGPEAAARDLFSGDRFSGELRRFSHTSGTPVS